MCDDGPQIDPPLPLSAKARRTVEPPISALMAAAARDPELINFAVGLVDERTLPAAECTAIVGRLLSDPQRAPRALQCDTTQGLAALRQRVLEHLCELEGRSAASMRAVAAGATPGRPPAPAAQEARA
jgi:DNA-binding transcriptional MocR family regulator